MKNLAIAAAEMEGRPWLRSEIRRPRSYQRRPNHRRPFRRRSGFRPFDALISLYNWRSFFYDAESLWRLQPRSVDCADEELTAV